MANKFLKSAAVVEAERAVQFAVRRLGLRQPAGSLATTVPSPDATRLPDGSWMKNEDLESIRVKAPDAYKLIMGQGFEAYQQSYERALKALEPYKIAGQEDQYDLAKAIRGKAGTDYLDLLFGEDAVEKAAASQAQIAQVAVKAGVSMEDYQRVLVELAKPSWSPLTLTPDGTWITSQGRADYPAGIFPVKTYAWMLKMKDVMKELMELAPKYATPPARWGQPTPKSSVSVEEAIKELSPEARVMAEGILDQIIKGTGYVTWQGGMVWQGGDTAARLGYIANYLGRQIADVSIAWGGALQTPSAPGKSAVQTITDAQKKAATLYEQGKITPETVYAAVLMGRAVQTKEGQVVPVAGSPLASTPAGQAALYAAGLKEAPQSPLVMLKTGDEVISKANLEALQKVDPEGAGVLMEKGSGAFASYQAERQRAFEVNLQENFPDIYMVYQKNEGKGIELYNRELLASLPEQYQGIAKDKGLDTALGEYNQALASLTITIPTEKFAKGGTGLIGPEGIPIIPGVMTVWDMDKIVSDPKLTQIFNEIVTAKDDKGNVISGAEILASWEAEQKLSPYLVDKARNEYDWTGIIRDIRQGKVNIEDANLLFGDKKVADGLAGYDTSITPPQGFLSDEEYQKINLYEPTGDYVWDKELVIYVRPTMLGELLKQGDLRAKWGVETWAEAKSWETYRELMEKQVTDLSPDELFELTSKPFVELEAAVAQIKSPKLTPWYQETPWANKLLQGIAGGVGVTALSTVLFPMTIVGLAGMATKHPKGAGVTALIVGGGMVDWIKNTAINVVKDPAYGIPYAVFTLGPMAYGAGKFALGGGSRVITWVHPKGMPLSLIAKEYSMGRIPAEIEGLSKADIGSAVGEALKEAAKPGRETIRGSNRWRGYGPLSQDTL